MLHDTADNPYSAVPASWVVRHAGAISRTGTVLDLACGGGRHARWLAAEGFRVLAIDRDALALAALATVADIETACHDLEAAPWPLEGRTFSGIIVTRYLHRPLLPRIARALAPGGVLIYETFMRGNEAWGRPRRDEFLLVPGELEAFAVDAGLQVLDYREGFESLPVPAVTQSICARRPAD